MSSSPDSGDSRRTVKQTNSATDDVAVKFAQNRESTTDQQHVKVLLNELQMDLAFEFAIWEDMLVVHGPREWPGAKALAEAEHVEFERVLAVEDPETGNWVAHYE